MSLNFFPVNQRPINSSDHTLDLISGFVGTSYIDLSTSHAIFIAIAETRSGWNPNDKDPDITLSGEYNRIADWTGTGGAVRAVNSYNTGKLYLEWYWISAPGQNGEVGITGGSTDITDALNDGATSYAIDRFGDLWNNNTKLVDSNLGTLAAGGGTVRMMAIDFDTGEIWVGDDGTWYNSGDPGAGTNPTYSLLPSGTYYVAASAFGSGHEVRLETDNLQVTYPVPSGFNTYNPFKPYEGTLASDLDDVHTVRFIGGEFLAWNPFDYDTDFELTNSNRDSTIDSGNATVRSVQSFSSGKIYAELKVIQIVGGGLSSYEFGIQKFGEDLDQSNLTNEPNSYGINEFAQVRSNNTTLLSTGLGNFVQGDVYRVAIDFDTGDMWFGRNGTWYNSGDPGAGTNPTLTSIPAGDWHFATSAQASGTDKKARLQTNNLQITYPVPSGFNTLGPFIGIEGTLASDLDDVTRVEWIGGEYKAWNPFDYDTDFELTNSNRDTTIDSGAATVRSVQSFSSGKIYVELKVIQIVGGGVTNYEFGIQRYGEELNQGNLTSEPNSYGINEFAQIRSNNTLLLSTGLGNFVQGDVYQIAIDFDTGDIWFGRNGTWYNSGDPGAGTNPTLTSIPAGDWHFATSCAASGFDKKARLQTNNLQVEYTIPSGFNTLGPFIGVEGTLASDLEDLQRVEWIGGEYKAWNPFDYDPDFELTNSNRDTTIDSGVATVRSAHSFSSGKIYVELKVIQIVGGGITNYEFGIQKYGEELNQGELTEEPNSWGINEFAQIRSNNTLLLSTGLGNFVQGDVYRVAMNFDTGDIWFGRNGTWYNSGDPGAGTNPTVTGIPAGTYHFATSCTAAGLDKKARLQTNNLQVEYTIPTGFDTLNPEEGFDATISITTDDVTAIFVGTGGVIQGDLLGVVDDLDVTANFVGEIAFLAEGPWVSTTESIQEFLAEGWILVGGDLDFTTDDADFDATGVVPEAVDGTFATTTESIDSTDIQGNVPVAGNIVGVVDDSDPNNQLRGDFEGVGPVEGTMDFTSPDLDSAFVGQIAFLAEGTFATTTDNVFADPGWPGQVAAGGTLATTTDDFTFTSFGAGNAGNLAATVSADAVFLATGFAAIGVTLEPLTEPVTGDFVGEVPIAITANIAITTGDINFLAVGNVQIEGTFDRGLKNVQGFIFGSHTVGTLVPITGTTTADIYMQTSPPIEGTLVPTTGDLISDFLGVGHILGDILDPIPGVVTGDFIGIVPIEITGAFISSFVDATITIFGFTPGAASGILTSTLDDTNSFDPQTPTAGTFVGLVEIGGPFEPTLEDFISVIITGTVPIVVTATIGSVLDNAEFDAVGWIPVYGGFHTTVEPDATALFIGSATIGTMQPSELLEEIVADITMITIFEVDVNFDADLKNLTGTFYGQIPTGGNIAIVTESIEDFDALAVFISPPIDIYVTFDADLEDFSTNITMLQYIFQADLDLYPDDVITTDFLGVGHILATLEPDTGNASKGLFFGELTHRVGTIDAIAASDTTTNIIGISLIWGYFHEPLDEPVMVSEGDNPHYIFGQMHFNTTNPALPLVFQAAGNIPFWAIGTLFSNQLPILETQTNIFGIVPYNILGDFEVTWENVEGEFIEDPAWFGPLINTPLVLRQDSSIFYGATNVGSLEPITETMTAEFEGIAAFLVEGFLIPSTNTIFTTITGRVEIWGGLHTFSLPSTASFRAVGPIEGYWAGGDQKPVLTEDQHGPWVDDIEAQIGHPLTSEDLDNPIYWTLKYVRGNINGKFIPPYYEGVWRSKLNDYDQFHPGTAGNSELEFEAEGLGSIIGTFIVPGDELAFAFDGVQFYAYNGKVVIEGTIDTNISEEQSVFVDMELAFTGISGTFHADVRDFPLAASVYFDALAITTLPGFILGFLDDNMFGTFIGTAAFLAEGPFEPTLEDLDPTITGEIEEIVWGVFINHEVLTTEVDFQGYSLIYGFWYTVMPDANTEGSMIGEVKNFFGIFHANVDGYLISQIYAQHDFNEQYSGHLFADLEDFTTDIQARTEIVAIDADMDLEDADMDMTGIVPIRIWVQLIIVLEDVVPTMPGAVLLADTDSDWFLEDLTVDMSGIFIPPRIATMDTDLDPILDFTAEGIVLIGGDLDSTLDDVTGIFLSATGLWGWIITDFEDADTIFNLGHFELAVGDPEQKRYTVKGTVDSTYNLGSNTKTVRLYENVTGEFLQQVQTTEFPEDYEFQEIEDGAYFVGCVPVGSTITKVHTVETEDT